MENIIAIHFEGASINDFYISQFSTNKNDFEVLPLKSFGLLDFGDEMIRLFKGKKILCIDPMNILMQFERFIYGYFRNKYDLYSKLNLNFYSFYDYIDEADIKLNTLVDMFYNQFFQKLSNYYQFAGTYENYTKHVKPRRQVINRIEVNSYIDLLEIILNAKKHTINIIKKNTKLDDNKLLNIILKNNESNSKRDYLIFDFRDEEDFKKLISYETIRLPNILLLRLNQNSLISDICYNLHIIEARDGFANVMFLNSEIFFMKNKDRKLRILKYLSIDFETPIFLLNS